MYSYGTECLLVGGARQVQRPRDRVPWVAGRAAEPIEAKASRGSTASLNAPLARDDMARGHKLAEGNVGRDGKKAALPHYLAPRLCR